MTASEGAKKVEIIRSEAGDEAKLTVADLMTPHPITASPDETLAQAVEAMREGGFRRLPVVAGSKLVGIITERDLRLALSAPAILHERDQVIETGPVHIGEFMTRKPITVSPDMPAYEAARILLAKKIGGLPVIDGERLVGMITTSDFLAEFIRMTEEAA